MHPDLWTVPGIDFTIRSWGFFVVLGAVIAISLILRRAQRHGLDPSFVMTLTVIGVVAGIVGCRGMYLVHHDWDAVRRGEVGLTYLFQFARGGEILGGVLLASASVIVYLVIRRKPVLPHVDLLLPPTLLAMGIGRIGCLLGGCCFGGACETPDGHEALPWAVRFPYGSPAMADDLIHQRLTLPAELYWQPPHATEVSPIPPDVIAAAQADDPSLQEFATAAEVYANARKAAPDSEETRRLQAAFEAAGAKFGRRASAIDIMAWRHLRKLGERGTPHTWAEIRSLAAAQHSHWLHPAQVYDCVALVLLFLLLSEIYRRRPRAGEVTAWTMILYPINRILQESIRADNPKDTFGLTISTFLSAVILLGGVAMLLYIRGRKRAVTA